MTLGLFAGTGVTDQRPVGTSGSFDPPVARASIVDAQSREIGQARLRETPNGILLKIELQYATPGTHAIHIHHVGRCEAPSFESAGNHLGTGTKVHGFLNSRGPHSGDLPNLEVPLTGQLTVEHLVKDVTLDRGPDALLDGDGAAIVIHANQDDYTTDPAGNSGDRIACGRIER
jgi:Cu-Zn family superoxide dismutase